MKQVSKNVMVFIALLSSLLSCTQQKESNLKSAYAGLRKNSLNATLIPWANGPKTVLDDFYNEHGFMPGLRPGEKETVEKVSLPWERRQSMESAEAHSYAFGNFLYR